MPAPARPAWALTPPHPRCRRPQGDAEMCSLCAGTGGVRCIICDGSGKMNMTREALAQASKTRDPLGGSRSKRECVACKGACMIFCKNCSGSGYSQRL